MNEDRDESVEENNTRDIDSWVERKELGCWLIVLLCVSLGVWLGHRYKGVNQMVHESSGMYEKIRFLKSVKYIISCSLLKT